MSKATRSLALVLFLPLLSAHALAAEYCVTCANPAAMYRCVIANTPEGLGSNPREQLACITELAKSGNHETCTASKSAPVPCPGITQTVTAPAEVTPKLSGEVPADASTATGEIDPSAVDTGDAATEIEPAKPQVPRTVEELAGQTVKSTKEGLKKAGEAVGDTASKAGEKIGTDGEAVGGAAKKTWNCITSFFSDC